MTTILTDKAYLHPTRGWLVNVWPEAPEDLPKAIDEAVELRTALPSTGQFYQFPKMMEFEINNGVAIAIQKGRIVQKSELSEMIAKVHDHIEGRYEIDSYDLGIIQSMLCELQPSGNSGELPVNNMGAKEEIVNLLGSCKNSVAQGKGFISWRDAFRQRSRGRTIDLLGWLQDAAVKCAELYASQQCSIKDERIRELEEALQYARNKTYILVHTKNAVSKTCQRDLLKMRDKIDSTIGEAAREALKK